MKKSVFRAMIGVVAVSLALVGSASAVCENPISHRVILETSSPLGVPAQVRVANSAEELRSILRGLQVPDVPDLSFEFRNVSALVVVGASRTNGCRATEFLCVQEGSNRSVEAVIEETQPGCGCVCTAIFNGNAVFVVLVPGGVTSADLVSLTNTFNCESCNNCPVLEVETTDGSGSIGGVVIEPIPNCP